LDFSDRVEVTLDVVNLVLGSFAVFARIPRNSSSELKFLTELTVRENAPKFVGLTWHAFFGED
jgi:hypothetical protein